MKHIIIVPIILASLSILSLEILIRISSQNLRLHNPHYIEISSDYPLLDELVADAQNTHPAPKYYDEFLYAAAPVATKHINYTNYYSARLAPDSVPLSEAERIIWTFGGSTMENTETSDELTIANTWAKIFNYSLGATHVKNFGTGGFFTSYELIKFQKILREVPETEHPTMAIFYDGFNDAYNGFQYGPGNPQTDMSLKLQAMVEHKNLVMLIYAGSRGLEKYSRLWERTGARLVEYLLFPLAEPNTTETVLEDTVNIYVNNVKMIQAICDVYGVRCFFVLQPLIVTKQPLSELEQEVLYALESHPRFGVEGTAFIRAFYSQVTNEFVDNQNFIDASDILNGRIQSDFYDLGHTGALTSPIVGEKIAALILSRLNYADASNSR
jgi:hypothetical protein